MTEINTPESPIETRELTEEDLMRQLKENIEKVIKKEKYVEYESNFEKLCMNGGNYLGKLYEIDVKGNTEEGDKETSLFVKHIIYGNKIDLFSLPEAYSRELFVYTDLFKKFADLEEEANIPKEERFKTVKVYEESNNQAIILENICRQGFETLSIKKVVSYEFIALALQQLAKLHVLSFVVEKKWPDYYAKNIKSMGHLFDVVNKEQKWRDHGTFMNKTILSCIREDLRPKAEPCLKALNEIFLTKMCRSSGNRISCLCHGDYYTSNILVKYADSKLSEVCIIDYQIIYYGNPMDDFLTLMLMATGQELRKNHLSEFKELYYEHFTKYLKYFDMDVESVYPRQLFEESYKDALETSFSRLFISLPIILADDYFNFSEADTTDHQFQFSESAKQRLQGLVEDCLSLVF